MRNQIKKLRIDLDSIASSIPPPGESLPDRIARMLADDAAVERALAWADEHLNEDAPGGQLDNGRARTRGTNGGRPEWPPEIPETAENH